jgi:hypothetical protein
LHALPNQKRRDEESAENEEDVDADEPTRKQLGPDVEDDDDQDRERAQEVESKDPRGS